MSIAHENDTLCPIVSTIVVTYKSNDVIYNCINSIYRYNDIGSRLEVIIVDNSPHDYPTPDILLQKYKELTIIKNNTNGGYGNGNNIGALAARGKYLLFLNPDTQLTENLFNFALNKFRNDKYLALFGIKILNGKKKPLLSFAFRIENTILSETFIIKIFDKFNIFLPNLMVTSGACMFMRKSVFVQAGLFDENIFLFSEEPYIAKKIKLLNKNYKIGFFPQKKIVHFKKQFLPISLRTRISLKSQIYFLDKFGFSVMKHLMFVYGYTQLKLLFCSIISNNEKKNDTRLILEQIRKEIQNRRRRQQVPAQ